MIRGTSAGLGRRLAALLYDALLLGALLMVFTAPILLLTGGRAVLSESVGAWVYLYRACLAGVIAAYFIVNWMRSGQTLGMRAWHLHVVDEDGRRPGLRQAALRFACAALAWAPAGLGVLWLYVDPQHLALHDRLSRTRLIHAGA